MWSFVVLNNEFNKKSLNFLGKEIFMPVWKFAGFENWPLILKIVINTVSKRQQLQWKVKAYTVASFKTDLGQFSKQKKVIHLAYFYFFFVFLCAQI